MMSKTADVVIIGGGLQGLCTAYYLSKKGLKVILTEQGDLANGTTSRSDGDAFVSDTNPGYMTHFAQASVDLLGQLSKELDCDFEWVQKGCILLVETEAELPIAKAQYEAKKANGIDVRFMDQKEVHYDEPNTAPDIVAGLEFSAGGSLNPMFLAYGLGEIIKKMGGEMLRFTKVIGFGLDEKGGVSKVITDTGEIFTKKVVLAAGVWSADIAKLAGIDVPVTAMKGDLLVVEPNVYITRRKTMDFG
jgi:glycine/D-amino acid oxidase-like deaminating enzyme